MVRRQKNCRVSRRRCSAVDSAAQGRWVFRSRRSSECGCVSRIEVELRGALSGAPFSCSSLFGNVDEIVADVPGGAVVGGDFAELADASAVKGGEGEAHGAGRGRASVVGTNEAHGAILEFAFVEGDGTRTCDPVLLPLVGAGIVGVEALAGAAETGFPVLDDEAAV